MAIHVSATTGCNLGCSYCYENPDREMKDEWVSREYDIDKILERLEQWKEKYPNVKPGMHGGEPLLVSDEDLDTIFSWIYENYDGGRTHIQTNGTMMTDKHVEMFDKYNVHVGISCDGPWPLNKHRISYTDDEDTTRLMTKKTHQAIARCRSKGVSVGVITVLHEANAGDDEKFEKLLKWIDGLNRMGVQGHFNPAIPYEDVQTDISLSGSRLKEVYLQTYEWMKEEEYRFWNPIADYKDNLLGIALGNCTKNRCDVMNAGAAKIIKGDGETTGCGKTWSGVGDGGAFLQGDSSGNEYDDNEQRYEILKRTPGPYTEDAPDMGGCKGCKYWNVCTGGCPSAGMNDDHRNRTVWCEAIYGLYEAIEKDMRTLFPNITLITDYRWDLELDKQASKWNLDIKPFAAMRADTEGASSTHGSFSHPFGEPKERVPQELYNSENLVGDNSFDSLVQEYKGKYDEEYITVDKDKETIHVDSNMNEQSGVDDSDDNSSNGWKKVN